MNYKKIFEVKNYNWLNFKKYMDLSKYGQEHMKGVHFSERSIYASDGKRLIRQYQTSSGLNIKPKDVFTIPYFIAKDLPKEFNILRDGEYFRITDSKDNIVKDFKLDKNKPVSETWGENDEYFFTWYSYPDVTTIVPEDEIFDSEKYKDEKTIIKVKVSEFKKILKNHKENHIRFSSVKGEYDIEYLKLETFLPDNMDNFRMEITDITAYGLKPICFNRHYLYDLLVRPFKNSDVIDIEIYDKDEDYSKPLTIRGVHSGFTVLLMPLRSN